MRKATWSWAIPLRAVAICLAIAVLGLSEHTINRLKAATDEGFYVPSTVKARFHLNNWSACWTIVSQVWLIFVGVWFAGSRVAHPISAIVVDFLNWVFWLCGFATVADINGRSGQSQINAIIGLGVVNWLIFSATLGLSIMAFLTGRRAAGSNSTTTGPVTKDPEAYKLETSGPATSETVAKEPVVAGA